MCWKFWRKKELGNLGYITIVYDLVGTAHVVHDSLTPVSREYEARTVCYSYSQSEESWGDNSDIEFHWLGAGAPRYSFGSFDDLYYRGHSEFETNPTSGLSMCGSFDIAGNSYGSSDFLY